MRREEEILLFFIGVFHRILTFAMCQSPARWFSNGEQQPTISLFLSLTLYVLNVRATSVFEPIRDRYDLQISSLLSVLSRVVVGGRGGEEERKREKKRGREGERIKEDGPPVPESVRAMYPRERDIGHWPAQLADRLRFLAENISFTLYTAIVCILLWE